MKPEAVKLPAHCLPGHRGLPAGHVGAEGSGQRDRQDVPMHVTFDTSINLGATSVTDVPSSWGLSAATGPAVCQALAPRRCQAADAVARGPSGQHGAASSHPVDGL